VADDPADVLYALARHLKASGQGDLRKQFLKELRTAAKPLLPKIRNSARSRFPATGGLNVHMAKGSRYRTVAKTGAQTAGVSIRANRTDPRTDRRGRIVHPIPMQNGEVMRDEKGRRMMARPQYFPDAVGYFRDPIEAGAIGIRDELVSKLERYALEHMIPE